MCARIARALDVDPEVLPCRVVPVEHHLAHIASAYYTSPWDSLTAGFSYDASGDFVSAMAARCEGSTIEILDRVRLPDSLGVFYTGLCQMMGFDRFGEEYKVMGLSAYGEEAYLDRLRSVLRLPDDGWFSLARGHFDIQEGRDIGSVSEEGHITLGAVWGSSLVDLLGPKRDRQAPLGRREFDLAKSTQVRFEEAALHCMNRLHGLVPSERLATAGGCALNGVANARILRESPFTKHHLHPAASDDGGCVGAALWCWHNIVGGSTRTVMRSAFLGPEYDDASIRDDLRAAGLSARRLDPGELVAEVASHLARGHVVGWHQGRSEWGPRALGNRSILADPTNPRMKDILNEKIKRRESFRPFAPSVLAREVPRLFEQVVDSPFMMHVVKFKEPWRRRLPAVVHEDGTGRLQTVHPEANPLYASLIEALSRHTGVGVVLNTSFNENEPIVEAPRQAIGLLQPNRHGRPVCRLLSSRSPSSKGDVVDYEGPARSRLVLPGHSMGGTEVYVQGLAQRLASMGHSVSVAAPDPELKSPRRYEHEGLTVFRYPVPARPTREEARGDVPARGEEFLAQYLRTWRPDVFHSHTVRTGLGLSSCSAAREAGCSVVMTNHQPSLPWLCQRGDTPALGD